MAIKEAFMMKTGMAKDTLSVKADPGESLLIKEVMIDNLGAIEFAKLSIDRITLAYLSGYDGKQNQFYFSTDNIAMPNLMATLYEKGIFTGFPVKEGQEFTIDITGAGNNNSRIVYETHDGPDMTDEMQGATGAKEYLFFNYGTNGAEIAANGNGPFDDCLTPAEFPDFPFGGIVPAKTQIEIVGLLIGTHRKGVYFGDKLRYLKFSRGREVLFDEDRTGFYSAHGMGYFPFHSGGYERTVRLFPEPLVFGPGDELVLNMSVGGVALAAEGGLLCLIEKVKKLD